MAKVMVLGSGGREHSLAKWFNEYGHEVHVAPGNAGTAEIGENIPLDIMDPQKVATVALHKDINLVVVGPEAPLCGNSMGNKDDLRGIADYWNDNGLAEQGVRLFGPRKFKQDRTCGAAMLEGSKIYARNFASRHGIPQPAYVAFGSGHHETNLKQSMSHWTHRRRAGKENLMVVKADGLCGGKGVFVCDTEDEVFRAIRSMPQFKGQGDDFLLEEKLVGEEASITVVTDGRDYVMFPHSQDHKRRFDQDKGPNTGGMGAYAPTKLITPDLEALVRATMIEPTIEGLQKDGMVTPGLPLPTTIYFAVMVVDNKPYLIEYNMRFGDPETQVIVPLMDGDPYVMMTAACEGLLGEVKRDFRVKDAYSACVVLVSEDYQNRDGASAKGNDISFDPVLPADIDNNVEYVHAGTKLEGHDVVVSGGRVLGVTAVSDDSHKEAIALAYAGTEHVHFDNSDMRTDIGYRVLEDE